MFLNLRVEVLGMSVTVNHSVAHVKPERERIGMVV